MLLPLRVPLVQERGAEGSPEGYENLPVVSFRVGNRK